MFKGLKKAVGSRFNVKKWMGYDQIKDSAKFIGDTYKDISPSNDRARRQKVNKNLSFEEMMQINRLTEDDVRKAIKQQHNGSIVFALISILPIAYAVYLFSIAIILGGFVSFLGGVLCLAYAYRFQAGAYQYRHRVMKVDPKAVLKECLRIK